MKRSLIALTLAAALPFSFSAMAADGISYNYIEGGYATTNGSGNADADGWAIRGSGAIAPNFHLFGGHDQQEIDNSNIKLKHTQAGVGYNRGLSANTDFVTKVAYENYKAGNYKQDGYSLEGGVQSRLSPRFTGTAALGYEDGNNVDGDFYGKLGGQVHLTRNWSVAGDVKIADGANGFFIGPRYTF